MPGLIYYILFDRGNRRRFRDEMNTLFTWVFILSFKGAIQEMKIYASPEFADIQCTDLLQQVSYSNLLYRFYYYYLKFAKLYTLIGEL